MVESDFKVDKKLVILAFAIFMFVLVSLFFLSQIISSEYKSIYSLIPETLRQDIASSEALEAQVKEEGYVLLQIPSEKKNEVLNWYAINGFNVVKYSDRYDGYDSVGGSFSLFYDENEEGDFQLKIWYFSDKVW